MLTDDYIYRFSGIGRLYGTDALDRIANGHVAIIGIGGVGSWAAESLARTGVGRITLMDYDEVCLSNTNRQVHALTDQVGKFKTDVMCDRIKKINPECQIEILSERFDKDHMNLLFDLNPDVIIDATDGTRHKTLLLFECVKRKMKVITVGGSGGRRDPTQVRVDDLAKSYGDRLLAKTRRDLRREYGFTSSVKRKMNITTVFSTEEPFFEAGNGCVSQHPDKRPAKSMDCTTGLGSVTYVTGTFGFVTAKLAVDHLVDPEANEKLEKLPSPIRPAPSQN